MQQPQKWKYLGISFWQKITTIVIFCQKDLLKYASDCNRLQTIKSPMGSAFPFVAE